MKKTILYVLLDLVFIILFNAVFFLAGGTSHPLSVWISYGFIHFAYLMVLATPLLVRKGSSAAVFGFALNSISSVYFFVELVVGVLFIFVASDYFKTALLTQMMIAGIYAILLLSNMIANEKTADQVKRREEETAYIKTASARIKLLMGRLSDKKANREIEKAYDLLHSSPTRSLPTVQHLEASVMDKIAELEKAVQAENETSAVALAKAICSLMEERNGILKTTG